MAKTIVGHINSIQHSCYCEPFMGGAHVFFRREPAKAEVLNDINLELVTLFRALQNHLEEFLRHFEWVLVSRAEFRKLNQVDPGTLTDIQRAARFYYIQKTCFGGRIGASFGTDSGRKPRINLTGMERELSAVRLRLSQVTIENLVWQECLKRYDRPHTLFYIDPPYQGCEDYYGKGLFSREDYKALADTLTRLKGQFLLSINDTPEIRDTFKGFHMSQVDTGYSMGNKQGSQKEVKELLITGQRPD